MLTVHCPGCGAFLQAPDQAAGKTIKCALCGRRFVAQLPEDAPSTNNTMLGTAAPLRAVRREELRPGDTLGEYEILSKLGQGGMGSVWKAKHKRLGRHVAVKVLSSHLLDDPSALARFQREVEALGRLGLDHPNLVRAYDAGEIDGVHFLVMELLEGEDLARVLRKRRQLPADEACGIVVQALAGLQCAHEHGLVHRDIKPSNLMLAQPALIPASSGVDVEAATVVKILDMGVAHLKPNAVNLDAASITGSHQMLGTPDYMAPEQITTPNQVDIRADLYSLGCTLYHLLSGRPPFTSGVMTQKLAGHLFNEPTALASLCPDLPPGLTEVVAKLMAKKREERYDTPVDALRALRPYAVMKREGSRSFETATDLDHYPPPLTNPETPHGRAQTLTMAGDSPPPLPRPAPRRKRTPVLLTIGLVLAVTAVPVALYLVSKRPEDTPPRNPPETAVVEGQSSEEKKSTHEKKPEPVDLSADVAAARQLIESGAGTDDYIRRHGSQRHALWSRAADQKQPAGHYFVARCLALGVGVPQDERRAVAEQRTAAADGLSWAQFELARALEQGAGTAANVEEALGWYEKAAGQKHVGAEAKVTELAYVLAEAYYRGDGKEQSAKRAAELYRKAAERGHKDAQYSLGYLLVEGKDVPADPTEGVTFYEKAAQQGHLDARNNLALCYKKGIGVPVDVPKALTLFKDAAAEGHTSALVNLATCHEKGEGVPIDLVAAIAWYEKAAAKGHGRAAEQVTKLSFDFAEGLYYGKGKTRDVVQAAPFYRKAAERGHREAQFRLGYILNYGELGAKNSVEGVEWYRKAAAQGHLIAKNNLGVCHEKGDGVSKDPQAAVRYYEEAARGGFGLAMNNLSLCYEFGTGVSADLEQAVTWCQKSADVGEDRAKKRLPVLWAALGEAYFSGKGKEQNYRRSEEWCRKAADQGNASAQFRLAWILDQGLTGEQNPAEAAVLYKKAGDQRHSMALNNLADLYERGRGVAQDRFKAFRLFEQSAELGNILAMLHVAQCYERGLGVVRNLDEAVGWYQKAADGNNEMARRRLPEVWFLLGEALATGKGKEKNVAEAIPWLKKSAEQGNQYAQFRLGWVLTHGEGGPADPKEGTEWYRKAALQGHPSALNNLGYAYEFALGVPMDLKKAAEYYEQAAEKGNPVAMTNIGSCYEGGRGVEKNRDTAIRWYRKAADKGNEKAKAALERLEKPAGKVPPPPKAPALLPETPIS